MDLTLLMRIIRYSYRPVPICFSLAIYIWYISFMSVSSSFMSQVKRDTVGAFGSKPPAASGRSEENTERHHLGKRPGTAQPNHANEQPIHKRIDNWFNDWIQGRGATVIRLEHDVWGRERLRIGTRQWGYPLRRRCPLLTRRTGWLAGYRGSWCGSGQNHDRSPSRYPALPYVLYGWRVAYLTQVRVRLSNSLRLVL